MDAAFGYLLRCAFAFNLDKDFNRLANVSNFSLQVLQKLTTKFEDGYILRSLGGYEIQFMAYCDVVRNINEEQILFSEPIKILADFCATNYRKRGDIGSHLGMHLTAFQNYYMVVMSTEQKPEDLVILACIAMCLTEKSHHEEFRNTIDIVRDTLLGWFTLLNSVSIDEAQHSDATKISFASLIFGI